MENEDYITVGRSLLLEQSPLRKTDHLKLCPRCQRRTDPVKFGLSRKYKGIKICKRCCVEEGTRQINNLPDDIPWGHW